MSTEQLSILSVELLILFMGLGQGAGECCNHIAISSNSHGELLLPHGEFCPHDMSLLNKFWEYIVPLK